MFVERDCAVGYLIDAAIPPQIRTWHGGVMGEARIVSSWPVPVRNYWSIDTMHQVEACINGVFYTGRSGGGGLIWRGRRKAQQCWSKGV